MGINEDYELIKIINAIIENPLDKSFIIDHEILTRISNNEHLMQIIDQANGWFELFTSCDHETFLPLGKLALKRAKTLHVCEKFIHVKPEELNKEALNVMEKLAQISEEFIFLAEHHHDKEKIYQFLSKGLGMAENNQECLRAIEGMFRAGIFCSEEVVPDTDMINQAISKAIMFEKDFSEIRLTYTIVKDHCDTRLDGKSSIRIKIMQHLVECIAIKSNSPFFGKSTLADLVKINNPFSRWDASKLLTAIIIIESLKNEIRQNPKSPQQKIIERFCQNNQ
jgi:hypothetical protein